MEARLWRTGRFDEFIPARSLDRAPKNRRGTRGSFLLRASRWAAVSRVAASSAREPAADREKALLLRLRLFSPEGPCPGLVGSCLDLRLPAGWSW